MMKSTREAFDRITKAATDGARKSIGTTWFLLRIMVPVSLAVAILGWSGVLGWIAAIIAPLMKPIGLPGEAALACLSGALLNNYSAIAVMSSLSLDMRQVTIIAVMCLVCHNLLVETAVMKKTGSSAVRMATLRLGSAYVLAWILNRILPASLSARQFSSAVTGNKPPFMVMLAGWTGSTASLAVKIIIIVAVIMIAQKLLEEFSVMNYLSRLFAPLMIVLGLPRSASFLWLVINGVGYAYGAGIIVAEIEAGKMKPQESDLFNHHAAITHSLLEDTILYAAISVPVFWLLVPRILMSMAVVWIERMRRHVFRRSFRVGTV
ncbi:MAG: nucleoside recognition domain-containing protein [Rectinemataceae bacterium]|nr:nucleoside recognition domain-containing protein [Rectinemataceae bacterium]